MSGHIGREFMEKTRHAYLPVSDQQKGLPQPPLTRIFDEDAPRIELPRPESAEAGPSGFVNLVTDRNSLRDFASTPISLEELSLLLWSTQGVKEVMPGAATFRTVPSAGARHALETLLVVNLIVTRSVSEGTRFGHSLACASGYDIQGVAAKVAQSK